MKTVIVKVQYEIDNEEDLAKLIAALNGTVGVAAAETPKPKKTKPAEPPAEDEEQEEKEEEEEEEEAEEEEEEPEDGDVEVPKIKVDETLKNATKLREVLEVLINKYKIKSKKVLLATCKEYASKIPILQKIGDLETRVPRSADLIDPSIRD